MSPLSLVSGHFLPLLCESRDAWEAQAASRQELEQRPWLCWRLQGARLEIKPNKNVWFVAFIFGRCQLQFELALCLEAGWVKNMKDALMNCWQSSVSSLIHYMMAVKTSTHCYTAAWQNTDGIILFIIIHFSLKWRGFNVFNNLLFSHPFTLLPKASRAPTTTPIWQL